MPKGAASTLRSRSQQRRGFLDTMPVRREKEKHVLPRLDFRVSTFAKTPLGQDALGAGRREGPDGRGQQVHLRHSADVREPKLARTPSPFSQGQDNRLFDGSGGTGTEHAQLGPLRVVPSGPAEGVTSSLLSLHDTVIRAGWTLKGSPEIARSFRDKVERTSKPFGQELSRQLSNLALVSKTANVFSSSWGTPKPFNRI